jgi:hypothetical protein|uniref:hypothetical protein n=1 Tax=uncultured Sphingomonas sp. TaxID=158754 RepID=UPI0035CB1036
MRDHSVYGNVGLPIGRLRNDLEKPIAAPQRIGTGPGAKGSEAMRSVLKSDFLWKFIGGFALGAIALVTLHPMESAHAASAPTHKAAR